MSVAEEVYRATNRFPRDERFGLVSQCRRSAVSIAANIAEGHGRGTPTEFMPFLRVARGSAVELDTELELAGRLGYLDADPWARFQENLDHISRKITNLSRSLEKPRRHRT